MNSSTEMEMEKESDPLEAALQDFRSEVNKACKALKRSSFQQEPAYVAALMGKLAGMVIKAGTITLQTTVVNDRGPKAAEKQFGADFALILEHEQGGVSKAILGQAKGEAIEDLSAAKQKQFFNQCEKIQRYTNHLIGFEVPTSGNFIPMVRKVNIGPPLSLKDPQRLDDYLVNQFIACHHGDTRSKFVEAVADSDLVQLHILIKNNV